MFDAAFAFVIQSCLGGVVANSRYQLEVQNGCPTRISGSQPFSAQAAQCLQGQLGSLRWSCALDILLDLPPGVPLSVVVVAAAGARP